MIKNIVFDMGGVILDFNLKKTVTQEFAPEYHDVIYEHVFGENSVWKTLDEGIYTFDQVIPGILEKLPPEIHEKISAMVTDFYDYMPPFPETYELIKELKEKGYKIYLLSNATPRFFDRYLDIPAFEYFDGLFISALYKLLKPNREIHEIRHNFNLGLGEALLSTALHDEGDTAPPGFHSTTAIEYIGYGRVGGHGANAVVHKISPAHAGRE